ncbi:MAG: hypothetical protein HY431_02575 [Candidatus Levybacteria bacterium]|nr:hypothetical protein [Candidatus Levybacteria bacterium]
MAFAERIILGRQPFPIDASAAFLPRTESAESLPLWDENHLITGGRRGTGKVVALDVLKNGGNVAIGTRDIANVETFAAEARELQEAGEISREVNLEKGIVPFDVDLLDHVGIVEKVIELEGQGFVLNSWVHAAAEGMQAYNTKDKLLGGLVRLRGIRKRGTEAAFQEARVDLQRKLGEWVWQAMPGAMQSNYFGPKFLLDELFYQGMFKRGAKIINFGSIWTDQIGQPGIEVPLWYWPVAVPKKSFDLEIQSAERKSNLEMDSVYPYTVIGQVIDDTDVGAMFRGGIFQLMTAEEQTRYTEASKPMTRTDMAKAVQIMLLSDPNDTELWTPGQPRKLYVLGPTNTPEEAQANIVREIPKDHPMLTFRSPI